ncbi:UvrD-helicase domain-containing protein [Ruminococcus sp. HUN007]|uniref:ATP-dependent helicase n=1 Tax=Ruminococcus sp. HUN007 TaxID=1514668 RepID=UPI0005D28069|nr:UvrD-helicase domain-containing protein [Ruminococcus sp. HUN007]
MTDNFTTLKQKALRKYFDRMNDPQREAVFTINGPVLVLAGAGSGKTTAIINRIANMISFGNAYNEDTVNAVSDDDLQFLDDYAEGRTDDHERLKEIVAVDPVDPWKILAITFTNKAANELRTRLEGMLGTSGLDVNAATFHSACVRILRREITNLGYSSSFTIYDSDESQKLIKTCMADMSITDKAFNAKSAAVFISRSKDKLMSPEEAIKENADDFKYSVYAKVYREYQKRLLAANALDFDDIIMLTVELFEDYPEILEHYQNRYRYIMVDEYQDTNYAQFRLVSLLSAKYRNICVVGDDDQSIYRFRGATIENILSFEDQFENCRVIRLEQNYRSTKNILAAANSVIKNNRGRKPKTLWCDGDDGGKVHVYKASDENDEARYVASAIMADKKAGGHFSDNAILYRMNAQSNIIERALVQNNIPYRVYGGMKFYDRKEIKDIIAYLSVLNNCYDMMRFKRIVNEPKRGIGEATIKNLDEICVANALSPIEVMREASDYPLLSKKANSLKSLAGIFDSLADMVDTVPLDTLLDELLEKSGYRSYLLTQGTEGETRLENIEELKTTMVEYQKNNEDSTLDGFLADIALYTDLDKMDDNAECVTLMTIHSAKGLEFENVYVIGMEDGIFPGTRSMMNDEDMEEERRLAYVAVTRAKQKLCLIHASQRMLFGTTSRNMKSRFIKEIDPDVIFKEDRISTTVPASAKSRSHSAMNTLSFQQQLLAKKNSRPGTTKKHVDYFAGDRVDHEKFGQGTVISVKPMGNDALLEIAFDEIGTKKIMSNFAMMKKL